MKDDNWLKEYRRNAFSQNGEDGVIEKILDIIPEKDKWAVEFGAWDGKYLSNTYNLVNNHGYTCVLIEGDAGRFNDLLKMSEEHGTVIPINEYVASAGEKSLDNILRKTEIPENFDVLSIDIDGNDYFIWKSIRAYKPKIVCIEFNPTIPNEVDFVQPDNPKEHQGASLLALYNLGKTSGYELVCVLGANAIFVYRQYYPLLEIGDNRPVSLNFDQPNVTYIFFGYDGKVFIRGISALTWHNIPFTENDLQILPSIIRKYPGEYNGIEKNLYKSYLQVRKLKMQVGRLKMKLVAKAMLIKNKFMSIKAGS